MIDTTFLESPENAVITINNIVAKYSDQKVYLNSHNIHSLYVFDITGHKKTDKYYHDVEVNLDSMFHEFGEKLEKKWNDWEMDAKMDTVEVRAKELRENMKEYRTNVDPELQELKRELKEMVNKMRTTRIVIIEDGDTIRIPKKE